MRAVDMIAKKRDGGELSREEIAFFVRGLTDGTVPDYQGSAWLMAVYLRGLTARETLDLTLAMRDSGRTLDLSDLPGVTLDKHSTGGVGDKTTLVVVPMLAAAGVSLLKMSGRGLGYSGGTVDKLESIPGFRTELRIAEAKEQVKRIGAALIAQTSELAPADKVLYALRDVTATVDSLPLIASSIMSKKLAAGASRIVLDVKVGSGAFMKTPARAEELARTMVAIGKEAGVPTMAALTAMDEPLGRAIGNALEVEEAIDVLLDRQSGEPGFVNLCCELAARGLAATGRTSNVTEGLRQARELLDSGRAGAKFAEIVAAQGGPTGATPQEALRAIRDALPRSAVAEPITAQESGVVARIDAEAVGRLSVEMGAGRIKKGEPIDPSVGVLLHTRVGAPVQAGDTLATLYRKPTDAGRTAEFLECLRAACVLVQPGLVPPMRESLVLSEIS